MVRVFKMLYLFLYPYLLDSGGEKMCLILFKEIADSYVEHRKNTWTINSSKTSFYWKKKKII